MPETVIKTRIIPCLPKPVFAATLTGWLIWLLLRERHLGTSILADAHIRYSPDHQAVLLPTLAH